MHTLPKFDFDTLQETETPISPKVIQEMLRYFLVTKAWHDDLEEIHRKVRLWKQRMWEAEPAVTADVKVEPGSSPESLSPAIKTPAVTVEKKPKMRRVVQPRTVVR